ncbi:hypothetical protein K2173_020973 [Erythroxylum novogranatense]|uniref:Uncharacterized protein n=1 Tax=Erythroxylum novogranatense TaxID=1862640 RepID=A0AAV8TQB2_9ROSI|nr:hypothetical protein K2173_020973 [Erythroxylum novogranatense]
MDRIGYAKICVEVAKAAELPDTLPILRLGETGELVSDRISLTYPWKPNMVAKQWVATGRVFPSGWQEDLMKEDRGTEEQGSKLGYDKGPGRVMTMELGGEGLGRIPGNLGVGDNDLVRSIPQQNEYGSEVCTTMAGRRGRHLVLMGKVRWWSHRSKEQQ